MRADSEILGRTNLGSLDECKGLDCGRHLGIPNFRAWRGKIPSTETEGMWIKKTI